MYDNKVGELRTTSGQRPMLLYMYTISIQGIKVRVVTIIPTGSHPQPSNPCPRHISTPSPYCQCFSPQHTTHSMGCVTVTRMDPITPAYVHAASFGPTRVPAYLHGLHQYKDPTSVHQKVSLVIKYLRHPIILLLPHHEDPDYLCKPDIHQHPYAPWGPKIPDMKAELAQQSILLKPSLLPCWVLVQP